MTTQMTSRSAAATAKRVHLNTEFKLLFGSVTMLCVVGWILLTSASNAIAARETGDSWFYSKRQFLALVVGMLGCWLFSRLQVRWIRALAWPIYGLSIAALLLVLLIGREVGGQRNWIYLGGGFNFQPSELAKLGMVLASALWIRYARQSGLTRGALLAGLFLLDGAVIGLVMAEGDIGTPFILLGIALSILVVAGLPGRWIMGAGGLVLLGIATVLTLGPSFRSDRIRAWLRPEDYATTDGYQLLHGKFALADGGWLGQGFGQSSEKWGGLPAPHTDFILPVIAQELGVIGTALVLTPLITLIFVAFHIADNSSDDYERMVAFGIASWIAVQTVINLGAIVQALPITGVPLPFVSYGGSSMVPLLVAVGVLLGIARHNSVKATEEA